MSDALTPQSLASGTATIGPYTILGDLGRGEPAVVRGVVIRCRELWRGLAVAKL